MLYDMQVPWYEVWSDTTADLLWPNSNVKLKYVKYLASLTFDSWAVQLNKQAYTYVLVSAYNCLYRYTSTWCTATAVPLWSVQQRNNTCIISYISYIYKGDRASDTKDMLVDLIRTEYWYSIPEITHVCYVFDLIPCVCLRSVYLGL